MNEKKFQFFVSSTYEDLKEARTKVIETILRNYHIPIGMEMFSAGDEEQWEIIKETIDDSDFYIVIIGHRYGSMTPDGISYTEKEYDYAKSKDIPILAFIKDRDAPTRPNQRDDDPEKIEKLDRFIEKASGKMRENWNNTDDLANRITTAVHKAIKRYPRIGWIKANNAISPEVSEELAKLSKENRELKTELSNIEQLKPKIDLLLNGGKELKFECKRLDPKKRTYKPIVYDEVPVHLREYVTKKEILEYNKQLTAKKEEIELFERESLKYWRIIIDPKRLRVDVINDGNAKANEIYIEIEFPEGLMILDRNRRDDIKRPASIEGLEDPLKNAKKQYQKKENEKMSLFDRIGIQNESKVKHFSFDPHEITQRETRVKVNNVLLIELRNLLHTRQRTFVEHFWVSPVEMGDFEIKISIICEEYSKMDEFFIPVSIIESNEVLF